MLLTLQGHRITCIQLAPAEYLVECETDEALGQHCMEHTLPEFRSAVKAGRQVVVAGEGFGCGSSREEAPRALIGMYSSLP